LAPPCAELAYGTAGKGCLYGLADACQVRTLPT
jgi:hypothetical protein